ncbi:MAG: hypothetical protein J0H77_24375 [Alphaproteobacteria bacterium]|nr:hypothetical protein [Alphaproteobacteria bacterium]
MESPSLQEQRKRVAEDAIDTVLASVERGDFPYGPWQRSCLFHAVNNLRSGHYELAKLQVLSVTDPRDSHSTSASIQPTPPETLEELRHRFLEIKSGPAREFSRIF